jgi:hypothetical protein
MRGRSHGFYSLRVNKKSVLRLNGSCRSGCDRQYVYEDENRYYFYVNKMIFEHSIFFNEKRVTRI